MTSRSKLAVALVALVATSLVGCKGDAAPPTVAGPISSDPASLPQQGANGRKAAAGGGDAQFGIVPAKSGEKTGPLQGGRQ